MNPPVNIEDNNHHNVSTDKTDVVSPRSYHQNGEPMSPMKATHETTEDEDDYADFSSIRHVATLMREQDAELLESIHGSSDLLPILAQIKADRTFLNQPSFAADEKDSVMDGIQYNNAGENSNHTGNRISQNNARVTTDISISAEALLASDETILANCDAVRRALSGEIWLVQPEDKDQGAYDANLNGAFITGDTRNIEKSTQKMHRTESMDRRLNEAAQFAEAVGDLPLGARDEFRIIEGSQCDDVDEDEDATEIHVDWDRSDGSRFFSEQPRVATNLASLPEIPRKTRPLWPFDSGGTSFLDRLPGRGSETQNYVYKGIQSNPPEIVTRGTSRGNYAQLHRKAWLEVSDKYHRYGKNLRLYYRYWEGLGCPTNMFFDWLDSKGEAAGQPLPELEECPRSQLDADTVLYITNLEVTGGYGIRIISDETGRGRVLDVDNDPVKSGPEGWIFVLRDNVMYASQKITSVKGHSKQRLHHSSFFGGKAVAAAGILITDEDGYLVKLYPHSGHYRPGEAHMQRVLYYLYNEGVDLRTFEMDMQQILHVARDDNTDKERKDGKDAKEEKTEKKRKTESLFLVPAVLAACFLTHKARFIEEGIFALIHRIRSANVTSVSEALDLIDNGGVRRRRTGT